MSLTTKNFTTTFSTDTLDLLGKVSKELGTTRKSVLEHALQYWHRNYKQKQIRKSYKAAVHDQEWQELGNAGLDDWVHYE